MSETNHKVTYSPLHDNQHRSSFTLMENVAQMTSINIKIGNRIRYLRKSKNISQEGLANLAEIDRTYMTGVETGRRNISVKILEKIIVALGCDYRTFFNDETFEA